VAGDTDFDLDGCAVFAGRLHVRLWEEVRMGCDSRTLASPCSARARARSSRGRGASHGADPEVGRRGAEGWSDAMMASYVA
jgi:hypothetical protein